MRNSFISTRPPNPTLRRLGHWLVRGAVRIMVKTEYRGQPPGHGREEPLAGPLLVIYNHTSAIDPPLVLAHLPRPAEALAASHLWEIRSIRWALNWYRPIPVYRDVSDLSTTSRALRALKAGEMVMVAPEGRISLTGSLEYGRLGVAYLAARSEAPVLPVGIVGGERHPQYWRRLRRAPVTLTFGPVFSVPPLARGVRGQARKAHLEAAHRQLMQALAATLPAAYRGVWG
ncbi:MAG: lysophospholipid acyltransferase family protein [Anaerolineae bacterium]